ncbi:c-type cytochrome [Parafilimonas terrae]|uniref:Cytochrome c n=1 Tax=Parafilimonas terrae TaxID=1465490 RepID=A0A1I5RNF1_9BACT|nr:c-type cytochrome [Parafilimonas terrae]SFP60023.1 cytochrome c [Parafilimonas terrae]
MKKYFVTVALLAVIAACNNSGTESETSDSSSTEAPAAPSNDLSSNPDYQKGLALVASNDCLTCHKVDEKVTGPAYRDVANKFENTPENVSMLAQKVINGSVGDWGQVAMTPHPALSQADAEQMVKYILLLRNK